MNQFGSGVCYISDRVTVTDFSPIIKLNFYILKDKQVNMLHLKY